MEINEPGVRRSGAIRHGAVDSRHVDQFRR
jgi:hypothetical protein